MAIDYRTLRSVTARKIINALLRDGFVLDRQTGSHQHYYHPHDHRRVTVSFHHSGQIFPPKILKTMIELQACWGDADLRRLKLIK